MTLALALAAQLPAATAAAAVNKGDEIKEATSIYAVWPWIDGAVIVGSSGVTLGFYLFGSGIIEPSCPCDRASVNALDRPAIGNHNSLAYDFASATVGAAIVVPLVLDTWDLGLGGPLLEDTIVFGEALSLSLAFDTIAKFMVGRPFPRTYAGDPALVGSSDGYRSFYSGHTALTATALSVAAMTVGRRHQIHAIPWIAALLVTTSVAVGVVWGGWHFPTDTIAGAAFGTAIGVAVPYAHFRNAAVHPTLGVSPDGTGAMLSLVGPWR